MAAIRHDAPDYTPHNVLFTREMLANMVRHTGNAHYADTIDNHIVKASLTKPQTPVPGRANCFADEFGIVWDKSGVDKDIGMVTEYRIQDVEQLAAYVPLPVDEAYIRSQLERLMRTKGDNFALASIGFSLFERAWSLCGMEDLLCYMLTDPEAVEGFLDKLAWRSIQKARIALEYGIDGILYGDDWGQQRGLIMGRPLWGKLIQPRIAAMYAEVKSVGKVVAQHSCGDLREILDDLIGIGLDVYQTFQPEIYDIREYKEKLHGRLTIWGAISTQADLPFKSPCEIYEITKNTMEVLGKGGGYIAAPTHDVPSDVPPENVIAMVRAFLEQGSNG